LSYTDAYSIFAALSLEAAGFAERGQAWKLAQDENPPTGFPPNRHSGWIESARVNPAEPQASTRQSKATLQLRGQAGSNQVQKARRALIQWSGGPASTAVTHVLEAIYRMYRIIRITPEY